MNNSTCPPPMGWNSWYCYSESVSDTLIRDTAQAMVDTGLNEFGWQYINIDDCWQGQRGGELGAIQGNERFPVMKSLSDFIHSLDLKIGIYSTPWIGSYSGFTGGSSDYGLETRQYLPDEERIQLFQVFGRFPGSKNRGVNRIGEQWLFAQDAKQWAAWNIDLVKVDWWPNDVPTTQRIFNDLAESGKSIHLSLSNSAQIAYAEELLEMALICRICGDIHDSWESLYKNGFEHATAWSRFIRPGHYIDPDMLQIGALGKPNQENTAFHNTRLTHNEQIMQMSLWCLLSAPLLISCDIRNMDSQTLTILTNRDVITIDQDPLAAVPNIDQRDGGILIYQKNLSDGEQAIGIFNASDVEQSVEFEFPMEMLELWTHEIYEAKVAVFSLQPHSVKLFKSNK